MMKYEEKLDYDRFHNYIWGHLITLADVSLLFREQNEKFIDDVTYFYFSECQRSNMSEEVASRLIKKTLASIDAHKVTFENLYS